MSTAAKYSSVALLSAVQRWDAGFLRRLAMTGVQPGASRHNQKVHDPVQLSQYPSPTGLSAAY